ncbi:MAG: glycosyltransferase [Sporolactobacillus sp.]
MKKILFLTTLLPYPLDNGGKVKTYNTLKALSEIYCIDFLCFVNDESDLHYIKAIEPLVQHSNVYIKKVIKSTSAIHFMYDYMKSLFTVFPYSISKFQNSKMRRTVGSRVKNENYAFIYVDHLPMMVYHKCLKNKKVVLDEHNVESLIFKRMIDESHNLLKKCLGFFEYKKLRYFEKLSLQRSERILCLSAVDRKMLLELDSSLFSKIEVLPIHLTIKAHAIKQEVKNAKDKFKLLFLGSMSWYPNQQGISWFMENVWTELDKDKFELYIVGAHPPENIKKYANGKDVFVTGYVDSVDRYIDTCDLSIVPLFIGSGQRVKIIECFAKGIPVMSTSVGCEGIVCSDGRDIIIADTVKEFIQGLQNILLTKCQLVELVSNGQKTFEANYSSKHLAEKMDCLLKKI